MEEERGLNRGSYIWGRSVHNTRIERLWYDVTSGYGQKWKNFFLDLEHNHGLDPSRSAHIWLLHHLFLAAINQDAIDWADTWNSHKLHAQGQHDRSPRDMFIFGMLENGPRGLSTILPSEPPAESIDDLANYGVDWEAMQDPALMAHHMEHNAQEWEESNLFSPASMPAHVAEVICDPPNCPFSEQEVQYLDRQLSLHVDTSSRSMEVRRLVWAQALVLCRLLHDQYTE
ncbi:hypothetical protein BV25DRAFT_1808600 [Artomyces pyxidatus]|uniref:Uncharacterized protein n=1 Tax=Artomyces pyxidatus TaxID=48021 RepID=A0ACB8SUB5_9AGAM|nr:hypothetical protein BV25DRAFT_1808600 [Artomyces pyxidatus]